MANSLLLSLVLGTLALSVAGCALLWQAWRLEARGAGHMALWARRLAWLLPFFILGAAAAASLQARRTGQADAQRVFEQEAARIQRQLAQSIQQFEDLLRGCGDYVAAQRVDGELWSRYVSSLNLAKRFPNVAGLGFAAYVPQNDLNEFLRGVKRSGAAWTLSPQGERYDYFVVRVAEPAESNRGLLGYDLGSELSARTAAERARERRAGALTGRLILLDDPQHRAFLLFWPVFRDAGNTLQGWTFLRFRQEDLLQGVIPPSAADSPSVQVFDGPLRAKDALFYSSAGDTQNWSEAHLTSASLMKVIDVAGRPWTLSFTPTAAVSGGTSAAAGWWLLIGGALTALAYGMLWSFSESRRRAQQLAHELTAGFREREKALSAGPHGFLMVDASQPDLPITHVNARFERMTGYSAAEALGQNPRFLYRDDGDQKGLDEIRRAVREQREGRALVRNYRKDGTPFWNDLHITPIRNDQGRLTHFAAVLQDVTEREQAERRLSTQVSVIRALSETPDIQNAAQNILQAICESQGWDLGTFWRVDERANVLRCIDVWRPPELEASEFERFVRETTYPKEMGLPGLVWSRAEPLWFADVRKEARFPEASIIAKQGLVGACGFPVTGAQGVLGVLAFYSRRIWPLNKNLLLLMAGTASRISQELETEHAILQQREINMLERGVAEFLAEGLIAMDREGVGIYANAMATALLGYPKQKLIGRHIPELLQPASEMGNVDLSSTPLRLALRDTTPVHYQTPNHFFWKQDGQRLPVTFTTSPILDGGNVQGVLLTFVDASELKAGESKRQREQAERDRELHELRTALEELRSRPATPLKAEVLAKIRDLLNDLS